MKNISKLDLKIYAVMGFISGIIIWTAMYMNANNL